ncbi:MAG: FAD-dependent oxidoreductase [Pseudomonadota bacterium]
MGARRTAFDVVVVGAGTAGAAAAAFLAESGHRVAIVERRPFDEGGARWINAVPGWMFDRAGVAQPEGEERHGIFGTASFRSPLDRATLDIDGVPAWDVDMRALGDRLRRRATDAGVKVFERATLTGVEHRDDRPRAIEIDLALPKGPGRSLRLTASLFVDATGLTGALRTRVHSLQRACPPVAPRDICTAASGFHRIRDRDAAWRFLDRHRLEPGRTVSWMSPEGGFSSIIISIDEAVANVSFVVGTIADGRHLTGPELMRRSVQSYPWVGERRFGGEGLIPLRRPYDRLAAAGVALVGDAGCQVFPVHGSGIGNGMIAARLLADATAGAADPGASSVLWGYQAAYQRERGAHCAPFDVFRRHAQTWTPEHVEGLLDAEALSEALWSEGILQRLAVPDREAALRGARALVRRPMIVGGVAPQVARMYAVSALYRSYPREPNLRRLKAWSQAAGALFGERGEIRG